ncbi:hypothetical protein [Acanthopleuribacter pedis]|uniref:Uncharacterized protein n=1 Tax=Acanthopleuribacter pedis TaxID=442870 RepID=A0A8J7QDK1_9BACT|nr:hypothetical protein [Acanthopleuribacter pedis]MBO1321814.1 hypothetical protein [Acanthopleuribacter pedis]
MPSFPHSYQSRVGRNQGLVPQVRTQQPQQQRRSQSLQQFGDRDLMLMAGLANINTKQGPQQQKVGDFTLARALGGFDTQFQGSETRNTLTPQTAGKNGIDIRQDINGDSMKEMMRGREFAAIAHGFDGDGQGVFLIKNVSDDLNNPDLRLFMMDNGVPTEMDTRALPLEDLMGRGGRLVFGNKIQTPQTSPQHFGGSPTLDVLNRFLGDPKISKNQLAETAVNHYSQMPQGQQKVPENSLFSTRGPDPRSEKVVSDPGVVERMVQKRAQQQGKIAPKFDRIPSQIGGLGNLRADVAQFASKTENAAKVLMTGFDPATKTNKSFVFTRDQQNQWVRFDGKNEVKQSPKQFLEQAFGLTPHRGNGPPPTQFTETSLVTLDQSIYDMKTPSVPLEQDDISYPTLSKDENPRTRYGQRQRDDRSTTVTPKQTLDDEISYPTLTPTQNPTKRQTPQNLGVTPSPIETQKDEHQVVVTHPTKVDRPRIDVLKEIRKDHETMVESNPTTHHQSQKETTFMDHLMPPQISQQLESLKREPMPPKVSPFDDVLNLAKNDDSPPIVLRTQSELRERTKSLVKEQRSLIRQSKDEIQASKTLRKETRKYRQGDVQTVLQKELGVMRSDLQRTRGNLRRVISGVNHQVTRLTRAKAKTNTSIRGLKAQIRLNENLIKNHENLIKLNRAKETPQLQELRETVNQAKIQLEQLERKRDEFQTTINDLGKLKKTLVGVRRELRGHQSQTGRKLTTSYKLAEIAHQNWPSKLDRITQQINA